MYIYIDESGNFGWPCKSNSDPFMIFAVLLIPDEKSKKAIAQRVSRAIVELKTCHPSRKGIGHNLPILELKGSKELHDRPEVRRRLFKRMIKNANFEVYIIILDKRRMTQSLPQNYMERYSALLLNILLSVKIPNNQKWVTMVVDSQAKAEPTQPIKRKYPSKAKRYAQKRLRVKDRNRKNIYNQMVTTAFRRYLSKKRTFLKVWHVRSQEDRCLQAVDVISNMIYQRLRLYETRKTLYFQSPAKDREKELALNLRWKKLLDEQKKTEEAYQILKPAISVEQYATLVQRKHLETLIRTRNYSRNMNEAGQP